MSERLNYVADRVLKDIDAFVDGRVSGESGIQAYATLINPKPFTSGKLKARIANKFAVLPVKIFKKSFDGYLHQKDKEFVITQQKLIDIEERIEYLEGKLEQSTIEIIRELKSITGSRKG